MTKSLIFALVLSGQVIAEPVWLAPGYTDPILEFELTYGPGLYQDQYGRPWQTRPDVRLHQNKFGPGVHSDQYGRIVNPKPYGNNAPY